MALNDKVGGEWFMEGDKNRPCAIFQHGQVLLVVNEHGALATAKVRGPTAIEILHGQGWQSGLQGVVLDNGDTIDWRQSAALWKRHPG